MRVFLSADVPRLEERIIKRVAGRPRGGLLDPVLILVPTRRLGIRLKRQIVRRLRAVLGVHILTHRGLVHRVLDGARAAPLRVLSRTARASIVEGLAGDLAGPAGDHLRAFQGARAAIVETLDELRQAGVGAEDLEAVEESRGDESGILAGLLRRYSLAVERLEASGWTDDAGLQKAALPHLRPWLQQKGIRAVVHHGSYELVGRHLDLLCEAALEVETEVLVPAGASGAAFAYARRLVERLGVEVEP
ncbi:MAG TPA: hypothetical protein VMT52_06290, partial [Planctomycetota bacterium]|nr:hypothetical protein [Planctomycetota bacterium]